MTRATKLDHAIFVAVTLLYWISLYIYIPILPLHLESLGVAYGLVGIALGSYGFMQIVVRLPLGIWSDRIRLRRPFIMLGMLTGALSCICFALTEIYGWALAARAIAGVSASTWVAFTVLYAGYYEKHEATRAMGKISLITVIGQLIGMGLSPIIADRWGVYATFWLGAVIGVAGLALAFLIHEPKGGVERAPIRPEDITKVMKESTLVKVSILSIMAHSILFITMFGFTPSYAESLGASKQALFTLVLAFMIPHALSAYFTGRTFAPKFGDWRVVICGFVLSAVCTAAIPFMPEMKWLIVTQVFNGFAQGLHMPILMGLAIQSVDQDKRATAMGFYQAVYAIGMFGGPFLAGWLNEAFGLAGGFAFGSIVGVIAAFFTAAWIMPAAAVRRRASGRTLGQ